MLTTATLVGVLQDILEHCAKTAWTIASTTIAKMEQSVATLTWDTIAHVKKDGRGSSVRRL